MAPPTVAALSPPLSRGASEPREILATDPDLAHAWELYQALHRIYLADGEDQANEALGEFIDRHYTRTLPEFEPLLGTLLAWGDEIYAFHDTDRATNGQSRWFRLTSLS